MPNDQMSLMQLAQMFAASQQGQPLSALGQPSPMSNPNFAIQPQGRYINRGQWMPNAFDPMALPSNGLPPDANTYDPNTIMSIRNNRNRQEDL